MMAAEYYYIHGFCVKQQYKWTMGRTLVISDHSTKTLISWITSLSFFGAAAHDKEDTGNAELVASMQYVK